jgi:hypothetical protein
VGIEGINMDEAKENAEKLSSLWEEDIRFYFKLLLKPWEAFEKPIPTRLSLELAAISTLFSLDISSPIPPRYFAQRFFCWLAYNSVLLFVYSLIFALSGKRDRITALLRLFPLTYISLILYGLFFVLYILVIVGIAFLSISLNSELLFSGFQHFIWGLIALWILFEQICLLLKFYPENKRLAPLFVLLANSIAFLAGYLLYRFFILICWFH